MTPIQLLLRATALLIAGYLVHLLLRAWFYAALRQAGRQMAEEIQRQRERAEELVALYKDLGCDEDEARHLAAKDIYRENLL